MTYPALDIAGVDPDFALAVVDDYSPAAVEDHDDAITVYFSNPADRDHAHAAITAHFPAARVAIREVDDEDWARRSQENLQPVTVGRITILPRPPALSPEPFPLLPNPSYSLTPTPYSLVIPPSMGFGTGHHQTTRLCLAALQDMEITGAFVLDAGTGSGVLALAAKILGAAEAVGIDIDADAIRSANENLSFNPGLGGVRFEIADLRAWLDRGASPQLADIVTANLTGALLARSAEVLVGAVRPGGTLILSGILETEKSLVLTAFVGRTRLVSITSEDEWVCLVLKRP